MVRTKAEILGETPLPIFLIKCRTNFKFFCENCLGVSTFGGIHNFQLRWFEAAMKYNRLIIESGTGSSKSEVMGAMYPLWRMLTDKDLKILLVSKTMEQSKSNLLARIKRYIQDNELLTEIFTPEDYKATWNVTEIQTKNGHNIKNVPFSENIASYRAHLIICDEIDKYENTNIFFEHVISRLYPNGQLIGISTPQGATRIIGQLKEKAKAGIMKGYHFIKTPYLVNDKDEPAKIDNREDIWNYKSIWPEMWDVEKLYGRWGEEGKANWMRNIMCENMGEIDDAIFPIKNIMDAFDYKRGFSEKVYPECMYFIGADFAISEGPRADFDAYVVVEKNKEHLIIKHIETHKGWQRPEKVNRLQELYEMYNSDVGTYLIVDESNMGTMVMNDLRSRGVPVIAQNFHSSARKQLILGLGSVFSGKSIVIPRDPNSEDECVKYSELIKEQLTGFKRNRSEKTGTELIESKAPHDDVAMALGMAINEAIRHDEMDLVPMSC